MKITYRRMALFTGASVAALAATPAFAQNFPAPAPHDGVADGTYAGITVTDNTDPVSQTIVICDIAATPECFMGVKQEGTGAQTALVNSPATGQIEVFGNSATGSVNLAVVNAAGDIAEMGAVALATAPVAGLATADATLNTAVSMTGQGGEDVTLTFDNNGTMLIDALAVATGTDARASADLNYGVYQYGTSTNGDVTLNFINDATMTIGATAVANGEIEADAAADNRYAIAQSANAYGNGNAANTIDNNGSLEVVAFASANATSGSASAYASVTTAIEQYAYATGGGNATNMVANDGTLEIASIANANGTGFALASADFNDAISQSATAYDGGDALTTVSNAALGVLDIGAVANAVATTGDANAYAEISSAIYQSAQAFEGGNAANVAANAGAMSIHASAVANGVTNAYASASNSYAISQTASATGGGDATNLVANDGTLDITADAVAVAADGSASASASVYQAISQSATAYDGGNAGNTVVNGVGTLTIAANAMATGTSAYASASNNYAIEQSANAYDGGDAVNQVNNGAGSLSIAAVAVANATEFSASASASIYSAISQFANATGGGDAGNLVSNGAGTLDIAASATANGATYASASASNNYAIEQSAQASDGGSAVNTVINGAGTINITAVANAIATDGNASASASVYSAIDQYATAAGLGSATNFVANGVGTVNIAATANAVGTSDANAQASNSYAIEQTAYADEGDATNSVTNAGTINITAVADATADDASATATVYEAIYQYASANAGGDAVSVVDNDGTLNIAATAVANGLTNASASATNEFAIQQSAYAYGGGNALADLSNGAGQLNIVANATAVAVDPAGPAGTGSAYATAQIYEAIEQYASATDGGNATANLANGAGTITIGAEAAANGGTYASASADNYNAISQEASAYDGGDATASLTNGTGVIDIYAVAAAAAATTGPGYADASMTSAIYQDAYAAGGGNALATIVNGGTINAEVSAVAGGSLASAQATNYYPISQSAFATGGGDATANITNTGGINLTAFASAESTRNDADAYASVDTGIEQSATANGGGDASALISNNGTLVVDAHAIANAETNAYAYAEIDSGISQNAYADGAGNALASLTGTGSIDVTATAEASGNSATAQAYVTSGVYQYASAAGTGDATAEISNGGVISAIAVATGTVNDAFATASVDGAIYQNAYAVGGEALALIDLGAAEALEITADASANGATFASASAYVYGISQNATALDGTASAIVQNAGTLTIMANADASATAGTANAYATVTTGIYQSVDGADASLALIDNDGTVDISAVANATGTILAYAQADAVGANQDVATGGDATFDNGAAGEFLVNATASASAPDGAATASAFAGGVFQEAVGGTASMQNLGAFNVAAVAFATGTAGTAQASAIGYGAGAYGFADGQAFTVDVLNDGDFTVTASATAPDTASAYALGMSLVAFGATPLVATDQAMVEGTIVNSGELLVGAYASGGVTSAATATGIYMSSGVNTTVLTNSGTLTVEAQTANGGDAEATGIVVMGNGTGLPALVDDPATPDVNEAQVFTFNNDGGTIIVRESDDGGDTWRRGMAIDVSAAPNGSVINLLGDGEIYGNIDIAADDEINVEDGTTYFDGIINPEFMPVGGITEAVLDTGLFGEGTLNIGAGGNLVLANPDPDSDSFDGPAYVFVETFNMSDTGTITFELRPEDGGTQPVGSYPQIFTDVANLDGTLAAAITTPGGLLANDYFFDNVIDAVDRNGTFDECAVVGDFAGSMFLTGSGANGDICIYDDANNVDIGIERVAFDAIPGLNGNQGSVAGGIECIYEDADLVELAGTGLGEAIAELFVMDADGYAGALQQLAGAGYASYLQSFNSLGYHYNQILARATDCEVPALAGSALACRVAPMHLWGQVDYDTLKQDGDIESGDYDADRWSFLVGGDISVTPAAVIGVSVGKVTNKVDHDSFQGRVKGDGWQFGAYGTYDPGQFYLKALGTYTKMNGDGTRSINFGPLGGSLSGEIQGDADVRLWTAGLHGGFRIPMGTNSVVTPFLNYDYTNAKLNSFTETGGTGVELRVNGGSEKHHWLTGGVKFAGQFGGLVPEASIGYRHMFGDRNASFNANFAGFEEDCDFDIISMTEKRGSVLAGLSIGGMLSGIDVRVGYNGAFNSEAREHSGFVKLVVPLGAVAVPPPPPVVIAPPPPPAPATQTCPDGSVILATDVCPAPPPPPPPPAPAPERG